VRLNKIKKKNQPNIPGRKSPPTIQAAAVEATIMFTHITTIIITTQTAMAAVMAVAAGI